MSSRQSWDLHAKRAVALGLSSILDLLGEIGFGDAVLVPQTVELPASAHRADLVFMTPAGVVIHVEIQHGADRDMPRRMVEYHVRIARTELLRQHDDRHGAGGCPDHWCPYAIPLSDGDLPTRLSLLTLAVQTVPGLGDVILEHLRRLDMIDVEEAFLHTEFGRGLVAQGRVEGRVEGQVATVIDILSARFPAAPPERRAATAQRLVAQYPGHAGRVALALHDLDT